MIGVVLIPLPGGTVILDRDDYERISRSHSIYIGTNGYAYYSTEATGPVTVHSDIMGTHKGNHVDHINGNKLDNRKVNLRIVSPQTNQVNRKELSKANTSGVRGVAMTRVSSVNPWRAQITVGKKNVHLGLFPTKDAAVQARKAAEARFFTELCP